jgi:hypothetical protein
MTTFFVWRMSGPTPIATVGTVTSTKILTNVSIGGSLLPNRPYRQGGKR